MPTMPTTKTENASELRDLKKEIAKLTGREPASNDPGYLAQRLKDLRARKGAGENLKHKNGEPTSILSVSMPQSARAAFDKMVESEKSGNSEMVRRALAFWATSHGHKHAALLILGEA